MKLTGYINGAEVNFNFCPPNQWNAILPTDETGKYIVQLLAIDDAGNKIGKTGIYVYINFKLMTFKVLDSKHGFKVNSPNFGYEELKSYFKHEIIIWKSW